MKQLNEDMPLTKKVNKTISITQATYDTISEFNSFGGNFSSAVEEIVFNYNIIQKKALEKLKSLDKYTIEMKYLKTCCNMLIPTVGVSTILNIHNQYKFLLAQEGKEVNPDFEKELLELTDTDAIILISHLRSK